MTKAQGKVRALELLKMVELPDPEKAFNSYPHELSGGQRQRAMIAQSISCDPQLLIADEPTTALDVTVQAEILNLMRDLNKRLNSAVILITHDMGVVAELSDYMIVMKDGVVVETGTTFDVFKTPKHQYTKDLLAAVPKLGAAETKPIIERKAAEEPVLRMRGLNIEYPKRGKVPAFLAVKDADLDIYPGEVLGLVGESGSGKTTIGRAVVGLLPIKSGQLSVDGQEMVGVSRQQLIDVRRNIGIVFQDPGSSLNPRWPIGQSIAEPLLLAGWDSPARTNRVSELLDLVELPRSYRNRYPHELSGGQRQRVGIARALALSPKLLVADEPTSALDVSVQARGSLCAVDRTSSLCRSRRFRRQTDRSQSQLQAGKFCSGEKTQAIWTCCRATLLGTSERQDPCEQRFRCPSAPHPSCHSRVLGTVNTRQKSSFERKCSHQR